MKPHSSVAITPGTAYGRKMAMREKRVSLVTEESSSRANSSASPSITGSTMAPYSSTRSAPCHSSGSASAVA
jgi:hypothetical protein